MTLRAMIVDDEPPARTRLRLLLASQPEVDVVAEAGSVSEALELIGQHHPNLLFLDVEMPEETGLDLLRTFPAASQPVVVFTTAHVEYALSAFNFNTADYLVKPFDLDRLSRAVERARRLVTGELRSVPPRRGTRPRRERIAVRAREEILFIKASQIDWISAEGNYARLHCGTASYQLRESMQSLEDGLDASTFIRVHRSAIVNIDRIRKLIAAIDGSPSIVLASGETVPLGPSYRARLEDVLGQKL
ncbi:MAG TPA: LytTR family DNA-binding domain-containing protein [Thermoanaerobaculia bacterium]|nr:LytTR family DNA-binding domain-containing protein [Thermoanaerobaculia bacterium]